MVLLVSLLSATSLAFYSKTDVVELTDATFKSSVLDSSDFWLIEFYAPWCGHCKNLVPEWTKLASSLKGVVQVGAVDVTKYESVGSPYGVTGFPTLKFFGADKKSPLAYEGARTAKDLASFALKEVKATVSKRLGLKGEGEKQKEPQKEKKKKAVVELTDKSFADVLASDDIWLVSFYAPWCGHCKNLHPIWEQAAGKLAGKAKFGSLDATKFNSLAQTYGVQGFPTIKVFQKDKPVQEYNGQRTVEGFSSYVAGLDGQEIPSEAPAEPADAEETDVVTLTTQNFDSLVVNSADIWLVEFFAPWCGHCKNLAPHWKSAATSLKGKVKLGAVDVTVHEALGKKYGIQGYPSIKAFTPDAKDEPSTYDGARISSAIVGYGEELFDSFKNPVVASEITSPEVFSKCSETSLCLVAFLPHILDSGNEGRSEYLAMLSSIGNMFRKNSITLLWAEAASQAALENLVEVGGSGYPAAALLSTKKQRFITFAGHFSTEGISEFVRRAIGGREKTWPYSTVPAIEQLQAWDPSKLVPKPSVEKEEL